MSIGSCVSHTALVSRLMAALKDVFSGGGIVIKSKHCIPAFRLQSDSSALYPSTISASMCGPFVRVFQVMPASAILHSQTLPCHICCVASQQLLT